MHRQILSRALRISALNYSYSRFKNKRVRFRLIEVRRIEIRQIPVQGNTLEAVELHFDTTPEQSMKQHETTDRGHGRIDVIKYSVSNDVNFIENPDWPGLQSVVQVVST